MKTEDLGAFLAPYLADYKAEDGHLVHKDKRKSKSPQEMALYARIQERPDAPDLSLRQFLAEAVGILERQAEDARKDLANFVAIEDAEDAVKEFLGHYRVTLDRGGHSFRIDGAQTSLSDLKPLLGKFVEDYNREIPVDPDTKTMAGKPFKVTHIWDAFLAHIYEAELDRRIEVREKLKYRKIAGFDLEAEVGKIVDILGVKIDQEGDREIYLAGFLHWLWQVKRYICGDPVVFHLMLSLFGGQGLGKTYLVRKLLCGPLEDFYLESPLDAVADQREVSKWTKFFVVNFEELSQARADGKSGLSDQAVSAFKALLTSERLTIREMYSHKQASHIRTFAAIATTNVQISKRLGDASGMRRFLEMKVEATVPFYEAGINELDFLKIWRSVDEGRPEGYLHPGEVKLWERLGEIQKTYIPEDTADHWIQDGDLAPVPEDEFSEEAAKKQGWRLCSVREAYEAYTDFAKAAGYLAQNLSNFRERISGKPIAKKLLRGGMFKIWMRDQDHRGGTEE